MNDQSKKNETNLTGKDIRLLKERGISEEEVEAQVNLLKKGTKYLKLVRPCTIGDGIRKTDDFDIEKLLEQHEKSKNEKRFMKFVPASGAASRMFKKLEVIMNSDREVTFDYLKSRKNDDQINQFVFDFFDNLERFAFYDDLVETLAENNVELSGLLNGGDLRKALVYLLTEKGMNYTNKSKALLKFHRYKDERRTALEEQIVEGIEYASSGSDVKFHFTVPPEQIKYFEDLSDKLKNKYNDYKIEIDFSFQKKSTDTIALDKNGDLFRIDGELLFRPGGHGALINNLNDLNGDLVFIKNIDNVQREEILEKISYYKKILAGLLTDYQQRVFKSLELLERIDLPRSEIEAIEQLASEELGIDLSENYMSFNAKEKQEYLFALLNKPIRVCGMVLNEGHPGGGPFWIEEEDGTLSKQIIESAQIDPDSEDQKRIFNSSTHFNPVDIVAGLKDYKGNDFDLRKFVNHDAVLVADKSKQGKDLKALELPGLWNGGMHNWISVFVEVPKYTFTPVKEVNDLLREEHR